MSLGRYFSIVSLVDFVCVCSLAYFVGGLKVGMSRLNFRLDADSSLDLEPLDSGWQDTSLVSCALSCFKNFPDCRSFLFNPDTKFCTPGSNVSIKFTQRTDNLYHSFICDNYEGFSFITSESASACVGRFGLPINYTDAGSACRKKGGFLMTVKTVEELDILNLINGSSATWIGLDDMLTEGTYLWAEDGSKLSPSMIPYLFAVGEPNSYTSIEDCIVKTPSGKLNDANCSQEHYYACQARVF